MRVLHVINNGTTCGGAERLTADLVALQRAGGHNVRVLAGDRGGDGERFADLTWPVLAARGPWRVVRFYWNPGARAVLSDLVRRWRPDVIHLHTIGLLSIGALPVLHGIPTVMTVHGPELFLRDTIRFCLPDRYFRRADVVDGRLNLRGILATGWASMVTAPLSGWVLRRTVDVAAAPSPSMVDSAARVLGKVLLVRNGVSPRACPSPCPHRHSVPDGCRLVMVGRLERSKGPQVMLAAMPAILAQYPRAHLTIVGTGRAEASLRAQAARLGVLPAVTMTGWLPPAAVAAELACADIAVVPSIWPEAFGLTALEALAAGCTVVASACGGLTDLIRQDETGVLTRPGDAATLASAVAGLVADPARRARLARSGAALAGRLTVQAHAEQVADLYRIAMSRHAGRSEAGTPWR
ncbi:MAG TPA: glycosyltransferase family 4 protein [Rugosimonospora sp.]|nr:glycosyltransferase family 4 protein [Rugosimonospora sp.]